MNKKSSSGMPYMVWSTVLALMCAPLLALVDVLTGGDGSLATMPCCGAVLVLLAGLVGGKVKFLG